MNIFNKYLDINSNKLDIFITPEEYNLIYLNIEFLKEMYISELKKLYDKEILIICINIVNL